MVKRHLCVLRVHVQMNIHDDLGANQTVLSCCLALANGLCHAVDMACICQCCSSCYFFFLTSLLTAFNYEKKTQVYILTGC